MERSCTLLLQVDKGAPPTQAELQASLESGKPPIQIAAMKSLIKLMLNGENLGGLLMSVIRYVALSPDHELKKLACIYYETVDKYGPDGKLLPEAILVCNALLKNLQHPNEYVRAYTLRFLCRIKEIELLEPLVAAVKENLEHRHSLVRRIAVMAVFQISKGFGDELIPDADEIIERFLINETNAGARRNAFLMLYQTSPEKAIAYFDNNIDNVSKFGDGFQLVVLELTRRICREDPSQKSRFIRTIFQLLQSSSSAVCYEAAWTLVSLSSAPTAIRAAAQTYTQLLNAESDNNVKLIVLDKLGSLRKYHSKVLQEVLMDIVKALHSPNSALQNKVLDIVMDLITPRNVSDVMLVLKKEMLKTQGKEIDKASAATYRTMLVKAMHTCAVRFASVADNVVHLLMDFLDGDSSKDVAAFVREIVQIYPNMRATVLEKLIDVFSDIKDPTVYRIALWILGEYVDSKSLRIRAIRAIYDCFGELPFFEESKDSKISEEDEEKNTDISEMLSAPSAKVVILADGTYATQTALTLAQEPDTIDDGIPLMRKIVLGGDYALGSAAVVALTRLVLGFVSEIGADSLDTKKQITQLVMTGLGLLHAGRKGKGVARIDQDSYESISFCLRILLDPEAQQVMAPALLEKCRGAFADCVETKQAAERRKTLAKMKGLKPQPDSLIMFRQLKPRRNVGLDEVDVEEISHATVDASKKMLPGGNKFSRMHQFTGFSDSIYAEAEIYVHEYDIVLDILVINRTSETLKNVCVELGTVGDLKIVERPQTRNLGPHDHFRVKANVKVSSTETGQIFGTIAYESGSCTESEFINLNEIPVNIMDYIHPATCSDAAYREMWAEFGWENKITVNTDIADVDEYLDHIATSTNMNCLTPRFSRGQNSFLASNLYARSIFGEDALVNVAAEKIGEKVEGYIRIRSKTQGIALSIGDRIAAVQKSKM